jgi:hypothetical protein
MRFASAGFLAAVVGFGAGCFNPTYGSPGFYCHPTDDPACPGSQVCDPVSMRCVDSLGVSKGDLGNGSHADLAQSSNADLSGTPTDMAMSTGACALVVNELQTGGAGGTQDEFIELYNACATPADLSGYKLVYRSATGTTDIELLAFTSQSVPSSGYLVVGQTNYTGTAAVRYTASGMAAAGGGVALLDASGNIIDSVGYGTAANAYVEGTAAPAPPSGQSIARQPNGHDGNNNGSDFSVAATPTPGAAN